MKTIILSFDDAREDFYTNAFPLIQKYNLTASLNVTTGFVNNLGVFDFPSGDNKAMSVEQILNCYNNGIEIAGHGDKHLNTKDDILLNLSQLKDYGINTDCIGFASPCSELTNENKNFDGVWNLVEDGTLAYIRSGIQIRREGFFYILFSILDRCIHSKRLFYRLNKNNIISKRSKCKLLPSVTIFSYTTVDQLVYFIDKMQNNTAVIFMLHSIISNKHPGYKKDKFYWNIKWFDEFIKHLSNKAKYNVVTTKQMVDDFYE